MTILTSKLACKYFGGKKVFKRYFFFGKRVRNSQPLIEITPNPAHCIALHCIDAMTVRDAAAALLKSQISAIQVVHGALDQIAATAVAKTIKAGGVLNYVAAGSSGLMALADASELSGTFGISQGQVRIFMAGGIPVDGRMPGNTEDDTSEAGMVAAGFEQQDIVIALSASGTTPFPVEVARLANEQGQQIIAIANNAGSSLLLTADIAITARGVGRINPPGGRNGAEGCREHDLYTCGYSAWPCPRRYDGQLVC